MRLSRILPLFIAALLVVVLAYNLLKNDKTIENQENSGTSLSNALTSVAKVPDILNEGAFIDIMPANNEKAKIIHIFTTWCECCKKEVPEIAEISKNSEIIGLAWTDKPQEVAQWLSENGNPYSKVGVIGAQEAVNLGISKAPVTIVIGSGGKILYNHQGKLFKKDFDEKILPATKLSD